MLRMLLLLLLVSFNVWAAPSQADTDAANAEFDTRDTYQSSYFTSNGVYEQKLSTTVSGIEYETHVYNGPLGKGCIHRAKIADVGDTYYLLERHAGPETTRDIKTTWTLVDPSVT